MMDWRDYAKYKSVKQSLIAQWFFIQDIEDTSQWKCKSCGKTIKLANGPESGYGNLFSHMDSSHERYDAIIILTLKSGEPVPSDLGGLNSGRVDEGKMKFNSCHHLN